MNCKITSSLAFAIITIIGTCYSTQTGAESDVISGATPDHTYDLLNNDNTVNLPVSPSEESRPTLVSFVNDNMPSESFDSFSAIESGISTSDDTEMLPGAGNPFTSSNQHSDNNVLRSFSSSRQDIGVASGDQRMSTNQAFIPPTRASHIPVNNLSVRLHQLIERRRDQERRIQSFRQAILRETGRRSFSPPANTAQTRREAFAALGRINSVYPNLLTPPETETHCYRAQCTLPYSTNTMLWSNTSEPGLRLFFRVPRLNRRGEQQQNQLDQARLKIFVRPRRECPCPENAPSSRPRTILVSVFQFIRPLSYRKRNRIVYRRQLLDSIELSSEGNVWLGLDIKRAVSLWMTRSRRNFGLEVIVTDTNNTALNAKDILSVPTCQDETERSCRDDDNARIERVMWPSLTLAQDAEPYVDVQTGKRVEMPSVDPGIPVHRFPFRRPRRVRSAGTDPKIVSAKLEKLHRSKKATSNFLVKIKSNTAKYRTVDTALDQVQPKWTEFLETVHSNQSPTTHSENCSCNSKETSNSNKDGVQDKGLSTEYKNSNQTNSNVPSSCQGTKITVHIEDDRVMAPKSYTTLVCPDKCGLCRHGQCSYRTCKASRHRKLRAIVKLPSGIFASRILANHSIVTGCTC